MVNKNFVLKVLAAAVATVSASAALADGVVNIYNWNDYVADKTIANFEKESSLKTRYDVYDSNDTLQAKLLTGKSGYDVVVPSADYAGNYIKSGVLLKLDKAKLSNFGNLDPAIMSKLAATDPGNEYLVPYMWGTMAFGINVDKVKKALGSEPMPADQWELVFNPKYTNKLKSCGISFITMARNLYSMANIHMGKPANDFSKENVDAATEMLKKVRQDIRVFNDSPIDLLANGDICVGVAYNGDVYQAKDRAAAAKKPQNIEYVVPAKGTVLWIDTMAIPKDAKNADNAFKFINYILKPEVVAEISNKVNYSNPNTKATALVNKKLTGDTKIYLPADMMAKMQPMTPLSKDTLKLLQTSFNKFKTAK
ncbi:extracellular solute-binding protein [Parachitinimonas caeni]|uniref:Putrescine-binding periplasmic protein n=1 Tax=Parachitinimonas caeni TaxID=3031301 RepID=A0ABT7DZH8_9NEIS|nr:extracellular solute-binding protein [Parachitinimonas caeni]MDK2125399.1 extracellular solute-binding protein [Parachitinimonas caeni]